MKKIILSLVAIVAVAAIVGGVTYAYFKDTAKISGSSIVAGTLDLKVDSNTSGGTQTWVDEFTSPVQLADLAPGFSKSQIIDIQKQGSVNGTASIKLSLLSNKENTLLAPEIAVGDNEAGSGTWNGELAQNTNVAIYYSPNNDNSWTQVGATKTLAELNNDEIDLGEINGSDKIASVKIEWSISDTVGNNIMSDSAVVDVIFGLNQKI
jgi:predicted ribosomally synthesized peptide with SipW-like signal peptide